MCTLCISTTVIARIPKLWFVWESPKQFLRLDIGLRNRFRLGSKLHSTNILDIEFLLAGIAVRNEEWIPIHSAAKWGNIVILEENRIFLLMWAKTKLIRWRDECGSCPQNQSLTLQGLSDCCAYTPLLHRSAWDSLQLMECGSNLIICRGVCCWCFAWRWLRMHLMRLHSLLLQIRGSRCHQLARTDGRYRRANFEWFSKLRTDLRG